METVTAILGDSPFMARLKATRERETQMSPEQIAAKEAECETRRVRSQIESMRRDARAMCGLEDAMWEHRLDTFPSDDPTQTAAVDAARRFARNFPGKPGKPYRRGLMLWGEPGRGKSGIMQGLVQAVLEKPKIYRVFYLPCSEVEDINQRIDVLFTIEISDLVIFDDIEKGMDDPGTRYHSAGDKIIRTAINRIDRRKKPIVCVTSNHSPEQHKKRWGAFGDRLMGMALPYEVRGESKRPLVNEKEMVWWAA